MCFLIGKFKKTVKLPFESSQDRTACGAHCQD